MTGQGRIRDEDVEEVRRRANLIDVASEYFHVKKAGRLFKALCPFHAEKTPSLSLDPAKNLFYCFGCNEGGDTIQLVRKLENLSFVEAVERLARRSGVELQYEHLSGADRTALKRRARLVDAHRAAVERYHRTLMDAPEASEARKYLKGRGFEKETVEHFRVGFAGTKNECARHLSKAGFTEAEIVEAGLAVRGEGGGLADRFRGRVMFPIFELTGDPVAFGARRLRDGDGPKYLNSAESPIYVKSRLLYALNWAKGDVVKVGRALLVEGYTDVIALHQAGIREAVATCGTSLGLEHLRTIQRFTQQVVLSLDADEAGGTAADRTYDQLADDAQRMGLLLKVVLMPRGDDPADSVQKAGPDGFRALVEGAVPLLEFVLRREAARYQVADPEVRARALASGLRLLAKTESPVVRDEYARRLSDWIKVDPNIIFVELEKALRTGAPPTATRESALKRSSAQVRREREALKLAIQHAPLVKTYLEELGSESFSVPAHRTIWTALATGAAPLSVPDRLPDEGTRTVFAELAVQPPVGEVTERLVLEIFGRLKESVVSRQIDELKARLQRVNPLTDAEEHERLFEELIELERLKRRISGVDEEDR